MPDRAEQGKAGNLGVGPVVIGPDRDTGIEDQRIEHGRPCSAEQYVVEKILLPAQ